MTNKERVLEAMRGKRVKISTIIQKTGLSEEQVLSALRNAHYQDDERVRVTSVRESYAEFY